MGRICRRNDLYTYWLPAWITSRKKSMKRKHIEISVPPASLPKVTELLKEAEDRHIDKVLSMSDEEFDKYIHAKYPLPDGNCHEEKT